MTVKEVCKKLDEMHEEIMSAEIEEEKDGALLIGTDGTMYTVDEDDAKAFLYVDGSKLQVEIIESGAYAALYFSECTDVIDGTKYLLGRTMIMKYQDNKLVPLSKEESNDAARRFVSRLVTLVYNGNLYSAYELS